ncbi:hypothetical protein H310_06232 [Aphanomyces invadans]|uniref:CID domain-containing protein n=1 Tax=Aphanomyces invadans TaxID=157072 RepID=A0A024U596_9STRA|nr:hypothetical protein H310_06232 [Aphanomyces invadans]ETW01591.1 hypothetical protein H310_06232 [Aphanomyces invadans]|eukprot:XP_008869439.1 hypothetical protein H310_06232 [Aphanomyces invadans]
MMGGDEVPADAAIEIETDVKVVDGSVELAQWHRAEIENELSELDDSSERINAVADLFLLHNEDSEEHAEALCTLWMSNLRNSDTHDRIPFLYVANHVLFKSVKAQSFWFQKSLLRYLPEAVSLVSNSPADRDTVLKILRLWNDQKLYPLEDLRVMWKETGEPLPVAWQDKEAVKDNIVKAQEEQAGELEPDLPMGLKARAAHPVVDCLKQIDHAKRVVEYLEAVLQTQHKDLLRLAHGKYFATAAEIEAKESPVHMRDRMANALQILRVRNKYVQKLVTLQTKLREMAQAQLVEENAALERLEAKFEQCDAIDVGLADLADHRSKYPDEWAKEAENARERKRLRELETKRIEEEAALRQQEALAANAKIVSLLEEDVAQARAMDVQTLVLQQIAEEKDPTKEYVWHPVLRELVPLKSLNQQSEDWRDH